MADTRKDPRAPVSLKVRYKSADLSEFIEQYSVDVSKGGLFIKTRSPLPIGTLLKFELQLKDESRIIEGVGRVVWIRRPEKADADRKPEGMGIKFIKMATDSRTLVDVIVASRGDGPAAFDAGSTPYDDSAPTKPAAIPSKEPSPPEEPEFDSENPEESTQVRHANEFLGLVLGDAGADRETIQEAQIRADQSRKLTEEIERQRGTHVSLPRVEETLRDSVPFSDLTRPVDMSDVEPLDARQKGADATQPIAITLTRQTEPVLMPRRRAVPPWVPVAIGGAILALVIALTMWIRSTVNAPDDVVVATPAAKPSATVYAPKVEAEKPSETLPDASITLEQPAAPPAKDITPEKALPAAPKKRTASKPKPRMPAQTSSSPEAPTESQPPAAEAKPGETKPGAEPPKAAQPAAPEPVPPPPLQPK